MSALKILDIAQQQGLLDEQTARDLREQVALSPRPVSAEEVVRSLQQQGHLTEFQARRLLTTVNQTNAGEDLLVSTPTSAPPALNVDDDDDDEDLVMLEAVEPAPPANQSPKAAPQASPPPTKQGDERRPGGSGQLPTAPKKPTPAPAPIPKQPRRPNPPAVTAPMDLADPSTELQPIGPTRPVVPLRPIGGMKPLETLEPIGQLQPIDGLQPLGGLEPMPTLQPIGPSDQLTPIGGDDLLADPQLAASGLTAIDPLTGRSSAPPPAPVKPPKKKRNQWDSPLLLVGGGLLGAIGVVFALLYFSLTRGSAAELFEKAEAEYNQGAYPNAIAGYDAFLAQFPEDQNASLARVRRGISQIRSLGDGSKDPAASLKRATEVLPQIENEPSFGEARADLAQVLPTIADAFAQQAEDSQDSDRRQQLVKSTEEAMELVTNPAYIPASLRKDIEGRISGVLEKLQVARRSIDQDQALKTALAKIDSAAKAGDAGEGYEIRKSLLRSYPALSTDASLSAATLAIAQRERELVEITHPDTSALTDDPKPVGARVVLADLSGDVSAVAAGLRTFALLDGAIYAIEVKSGRVSWRRYVGVETTTQPIPLGATPDADVLVVERRSNSLLKLKGSTGELVWRQELGERAFEPAVLRDAAFIATASGKILSVRLSDGVVTTQAQLPQRLTVGPCIDAKRNRLYQAGEHSTVFVLSTQTLECHRTHYLGHTVGAILAPPVVVLEHLLIPESPSDDYSLLHILKPSGENGELAEPGSPFRLKGRIGTPLSTSGRRAAVVTDLGEISVFEIDSAGEKQSVRELGRVTATDSQRVNYHHVLEGSQLWVAGRRCALYEIQAAVQKLSRVWSLYQDDAFVGPLRLFDSTLVHVRRRPRAPGILVDASRAGDGTSQWQCSLTSPLVAVMASDARAQLGAVTAAGRVFEIDRSALSAGYGDSPVSQPPTGTGSFSLRNVTELAPGRIVCSNFEQSPQALVYDVAAPENRSRWLKMPAAVADATAAPALFQGGLLTPLSSGRVLLLSPDTGEEVMRPFQPKLEAGVSFAWTTPTALPPDGSTAAVSDGLSRLFRITAQQQPQPHLDATVERPLEGLMESPLAATGEALYGVVRSKTGEQLRAYQSDDLAPVGTWPLTGRCSLGPVAIDGRVYAADDNSLLCLGAERQLLWKHELEHGGLSRAPLVKDGDLIVVHQNGIVARLHADTGEETASIDVGEPLGNAASIVGQRLLVGGADGTLHLVNLPRRP